MHTLLSSLIFYAIFSFNIPSLEACTALPLHDEQHHGQDDQRTLCTFPDKDTVSARLKRLLEYEYAAPPYAVARGVQSVGNLARLQRFAEKVLAGESVGVGVAGGSFSTGEGDIVSHGMDPGCVPSPAIVRSRVRFLAPVSTRLSQLVLNERCAKFSRLNLPPSAT
jgi:hypothetical protein